MNSKNIAILLATYNSEKYLCEQLDSLFEQSYQEFDLYIRDDGSSDRTLEIVEQYSAKYPNITLLSDETTGRGAKGSFMWMLQRVDAPYYMFCDHDDVWKPEKIQFTFDKMQQLEQQNNSSTPVVVNTDLEIVDQSLNTIHPSMFRYARINISILHNYKYLAVTNGFTGCTMMINRAAKEISLPFSQSATMHDYWIALNVAARGGVLGYVDAQTIKYRQHSSNVVGAQRSSGLFRVITKIDSKLSSYRRTLNMLDDIEPMSMAEYLLYKFLYFVRR